MLRVLLVIAFSLQCGNALAISRGIAPGPGHSEENVNGIQTGAYPFVNFLKECTAVNPNVDVTTSSGGQFNNDGYPQVSPSVEQKCNFYAPAAAVGIAKSGNNSWFIAWTGTVGSGSGRTGHAGMRIQASAFGGALTNVSDSCSGCNTVANSGGSLYLTGTNGWAKFTPAAVSSNYTLGFIPAPTYRGIKSGGIAGISNIAVCPGYLLTGTDAQKAAQCLAAGNTFNPDYLAMLRTINPRVLRMTLSPQNMQNNHRSRWAYEPPATSMTFGREQYLVDPSLGVWAGSIYYGTAEALNCGSANAYCVNAPANFPGLVDGTTIQGLVLNAPAANPTLNVGGTGDIPIVNYIVQLGGGVPANKWSANSINTFTYDALLNKWIQNPAGLTPVMPVSVQAALCNALQKDCWVSIPFFYNQASAASLGSALASSLNPANKAYIEYGNELFNSWPLYWLSNRSAALGLPSPTSYVSGVLVIPRAGDLYEILNYTAVKNAWPAGDTRLHFTLPDFILRTTIGYEERLVSTAMTFDSGGRFTTGPGGCSVTGSIATNGTMTIASTPSCSIYRGMVVTGNGISANTIISDFFTNSLSNVWTSGTIHVAPAPSGTVGSEIITLGAGGSGNAIAADYTQVGQRLGDLIDTESSAMYVQGPNINYSVGYYLYPPGPPGTNSALLSAVNISNIDTSSNPATITTATPHGYSNGDRVQLTLPAGTGLSAISGAWTTVSNATSTTFQVSNTYNSSGSTPITDLTIYTYGSGGSMQKLSAAPNTGAVGLNSAGLLTAADQYASGDPSLMAFALSWMHTEVTAGFSYLFSGGLDSFSAASTYWSAQIGKPVKVICYEGGYQGTAMPVNTAHQLGIDSSYANKIASLMNGYFFSDLYRQDWNNLYKSVVALPNVTAPSNLQQTGVTRIGSAVTGSISDGSGSGAGNVLTVTSGSGLQVGYAINGAGINPQTTILAFGPGTTGGPGNYIVSQSQLVPRASNNIFYSSGVVWKYYTGDIYSQPYRNVYGVRDFNFNFLLKRDLDPASNDNSPMWLEKVA